MPQTPPKLPTGGVQIFLYCVGEESQVIAPARKRVFRVPSRVTESLSVFVYEDQWGLVVETQESLH